MGAEKSALENALKNFPPPATGILVNFERRWLGMMTKMKKMNVLIYQVTRFARDNKKIRNTHIFILSGKINYIGATRFIEPVIMMGTEYTLYSVF